MSEQSIFGAQLAQEFCTRFVCLPALDPDSQRTCYQIRHQVYCEEMGFESASAEGLEIDDYDQSALHILLCAKEGGRSQPIGCTRLVMTDGLLPMQRHAGVILNEYTTQFRKAAEVSRMAVLPSYRRRLGERSAAIPDAFTVQHARYPFMLVGLCMGVLDIARRLDIGDLLMLTERSLAVRLQRLGVPMQPAGAAVHFRGQRFPAHMHTRSILEGLSPATRELYNAISGQIETALWQRVGYAA